MCKVDTFQVSHCSLKQDRKYVTHSYRPQRSCGQGYVFTRVCLSTGGSVWAGTLQTRYTPGPGTPPGLGTPPGTRNNPRTRYTPGPGKPP